MFEKSCGFSLHNLLDFLIQEILKCFHTFASHWLQNQDDSIGTIVDSKRHKPPPGGFVLFIHHTEKVLITLV